METKNTDQRTQSFGMKAVWLDFNPSGNADVQRVKELYAAVIDILHWLSFWLEWLTTEELIKKAIEEAQTAQMRAVKAITWKD